MEAGTRNDTKCGGALAAALVWLVAASLSSHAGDGPQTHEVTLGNNFFSPGSLVIHVGDTVRWSNSTGVGHNVRSCIPGEDGCNDAIANETFFSGAASGFFVYSHTFTQVGHNPYVCQPHAPQMTGLVTVVDGPVTPPVVGDGTVGQPMRVRKLSPDGSTLEIAWDWWSCVGATDHHILYGLGSQLPTTPGDPYGLRGAACDIGLQSPYTWTGVPAPTQTNPMLWWVVVADDGSATEGSWGTDSLFNERDALGPEGASQQCAISSKDLSNTCGQ